MTLLVIDVQKCIVTEALFHCADFISNVKILLRESRKRAVEVIYVRHDDGEEAELAKGKEGFEIYEEFAPLPGERVFDKEVNSAFKGTELLEYLREKGEKTIIVCGLQTDYCMDATVKCGFEHGFHVIVPSYANTTVDNAFMTGEQSYQYYNEFIWPGRYAQCISMEETVKYLGE